MTQKLSKTERNAWATTGMLDEIKGSVDFLRILNSEKPELKKLCATLLAKYRVMAEVFLDTVRNDSLLIHQEEDGAFDDKTSDEDSRLLTHEEIQASINRSDN